MSLSPIALRFLSECENATARGVPLGDLVETIQDYLVPGWIDGEELDHWIDCLNDVAPRPDVPSAGRLAWYLKVGRDCWTGLPISE